MSAAPRKLVAKALMKIKQSNGNQLLKLCELSTLTKYKSVARYLAQDKQLRTGINGETSAQKLSSLESISSDTERKPSLSCFVVFDALHSQPLKGLRDCRNSRGCTEGSRFWVKRDCQSI